MIENYKNKIIHNTVLEGLAKLPEASVDCVVTSPPYWQLRDYGYSEQWGLEPTFQEYLEHLWQFMDEVNRVLKPTGTVWVNLGDTYGSFRGKNGNQADSFERKNNKDKKSVKQVIDRPIAVRKKFNKCQLLIPHRFAIGCIDRGWIMRNDIIWAKPNGMPESVRDRFSKKHEFIFFMVKSQKYYFNLNGIREPHKQVSIDRAKRGVSENNKWLNGADGQSPHNLSRPRKNTKYYNNKLVSAQVRDDHDIHQCLNPKGKNPGDVSDFWAISTKPSKAKHYATFNSELINKPIIAGCPEGGIVLDPFCGVGTTLMTAKKLGRNFIGIEAKEEYCKIAEENVSELALAI